MTRDSNPQSSTNERFQNIDIFKCNFFTQFPLSKETLKGLKLSGYTKPTAIQKLVLKPALLGQDVVAEAPTGSGKTIAFAIPVLELLHQNKVSMFDGPVAIILTPTRELSRQIFSVFAKIAREHHFTMMNIMGGKVSVLKNQEWNSISRANILIGTPGRMAQHQTENSLLDTSNLKLLILDEADRLLDPTFREDLEVILQNLTPDRQTLLFSATLTKATDQLVRLSMRNPITVSVNNNNINSTNNNGTTLSKELHTPSELLQYYAIVPLEQKLDTLWTFLQSHCKKKIIVFFSTQKQVRYAYELFQLLRPYFKILQLRGNMNQQKRFQVYDRFANSPHGSVLLATNLAERGLDFPNVHWVVQFDCPHFTEDYIHRIGRTGRNGHIGRSILFLLPSEQNLINILAKHSVVLKPVKFPESKLQRRVSKESSSLLARKLELTQSARLAFTAYLRDYCLMARRNPTKQQKQQQPSELLNVFNAKDLPVEKFANSLGLPFISSLPKEFIQLVPDSVKLIKSFPSVVSNLSDNNDNQLSTTTSTTTTDNVFNLMKMKLPHSTELISLNINNNIDEDDDHNIDSDDNLLIKKSSINVIPNETKLKPLDLVQDTSSDDNDDDIGENDQHKTNQPEKSRKSINKLKKLSRIQLAKKELKQKIRSHRKLEFDDEGHVICEKIGDIPIAKPPIPINDQIETTMASNEALNIDQERRLLHEIIDKEDKKLWRQRIRQRHQAERKKLKEERKKLNQLNGPKVSLKENSSDSTIENESD
ncbi:unnamed protein product [Schistosoma rodhaini]|nr:unnamed protein product [Schistosoma rodhaini]